MAAIYTLKKARLESWEYGRGRKMSEAVKKEILDFVNFYEVLGIVQLETLCIRH